MGPGWPAGFWGLDGEKGEPFPLDFLLLYNRLNVFVPSDGETFEEYMQYNEMKEEKNLLRALRLSRLQTAWVL